MERYVKVEYILVRLHLEYGGHFGHPAIGRTSLAWKACREDLRGARTRRPEVERVDEQAGTLLECRRHEHVLEWCIQRHGENIG